MERRAAMGADSLAHLAWNDPLGVPQERTLTSGEVLVLGREPGNDICVPHPEVSRRHAAIISTEAGFEVKDLGSANGTFVNGERLSEPRLLLDGDRLRLAGLELRFSTSVQASSPAETIERPAGRQAPRLIVTGGPHEGAEFVLRFGSIRIGRATSQGDEPDIPLQDRTVSRPHAELRRAEGGYGISDLGSVNGTWLNGRKLSGPVTLQDGDVIQLGGTTLLYRTGEEAAS